MTDLLDKNKSAFKLKGIGPIYCINLDGQPERWEFMSNQFKYWEIEDKVTFLTVPLYLQVQLLMNQLLMLKN